MKRLTNAALEAAPLTVGTSAVSRNELAESTPVDVLPDSRGSAIGIVSEVHDSRVRDMLDQLLEYSKDHPGLIKNIRLRERTLGVFMPDNGSKALDEFDEKHGSSQVQVLRNVCDSNVMAILGKESTVDFNIADSEQ